MHKSTMLLLLFCSLSLISIATSSDTSFLQCLSSSQIIQQNQLPSLVFTPRSNSFTNELTLNIRNSRLNTSTTPKPTMILKPSQQSQVPPIVTCAKSAGIYLKIRSGGHDYDGLSYTAKTPFAILDTSNLRSIDIDIKTQTAWVSTGNTLGELYYKIWQTSKVHAFPAGVCPTLGIGGHFSGGGYGNMMRKYGLSVDNVIDAKIVDANGRLLDRKGMGEDLFWAIRGGGGASFGVILAYRINLVPVPANVTLFRLPRTLEQNATDLVYRWQYIADKLDRELFVRVNLLTGPGDKGKTTVTAYFIAMYLGGADKLVSIVNAKFPELGLKRKDCKEMSWAKSLLFFAEFPEGATETALLDRQPFAGSAFKMKSDYVKTPIPRDGLRSMFQRMIAAGNINIQFNPYGGRMAEIPESEIPFPHRAGNIFKIQYLINWNETGPANDIKNINKQRQFHDFMTPFVSKNPREAFLNYRDIDNGVTDNGPNAYKEGKVYGEKYFKGNFDRLVDVKTKVDPTNFFRNEQSIPVRKY